MKSWLKLVVCMSLACISASATAVRLDGDSNALLSGTAYFYDVGSGPEVLDVYVEYAVYLPGQYGGSAPGKDVQLVYAYQIFNDRNPNSTHISSFSVGALYNGINQGSDGSYGQTPGGIVPAFQMFTTVRRQQEWQYFCPKLSHTYGLGS